MVATSVLYNFWFYELNDVYLVRYRVHVLASWLTADVKTGTHETGDRPLISEKRRISAQQTLYMCLNHGVWLRHPFMPFVTEELWQRLSRWPAE